MIFKHLYMETFGCQMNVSDSERIVAMLAGVGYKQNPVLKLADLILLNTCSVRGGAEEKVYKRLENLRVLKKANKGLVIGVGGCVAQHEGDLLLEKFPWVDLVFGTHNLHLLPDMVAAAEGGQRRS
jgi:tRNA-2-methylthio-N6-dimethylallyladenosine synthase